MLFRHYLVFQKFSLICADYIENLTWLCYVHNYLVLQNSARLSVPGGASVACSTAKAVEWDAAWSNNLDPSGRAALGVHLSAYDNQAPSVGTGMPQIIDNVPLKMELSTPGVAIQS